MAFSPSSPSRPIVLDSSRESEVYGLFAIAMGLTGVGVWIGAQYAAYLLNSAFFIFAAIAEIAIILTSSLWARKSPLNVILFGAFPLLTGITVTPYLMSILIEYTNGAAILFNAIATTALLSATAAVFARTTSWNLSGMARMLIFALIGIILFSILQIFVPSLRGTQFELLLSGAGVVIFSLFTAYDFQRVKNMHAGDSSFMMALSLYLDIFNLLLMVLRFMTAMSGQRRNSW